MSSEVDLPAQAAAGFCGEAELLGPKKVIDAAREIGGRLLGQEPKGAEDTNETGGTGRYG